MRYPIKNLGQVAPPAAPPPTCPAVPSDPNLNCQKTPNGGVLCSDGTYFPPGCVTLPAITTPGVTGYTRSPGSAKLSTPPPFSLAEETGEGFPYLPVGVAVAGIIFAVVF